MAYDPQEQEQLDSFKAWWEKYGNFILTTATVVLLAFAAYNGWRWYERSQAQAAAGIYEQLVKAVEAKDQAKAKEMAGNLIEKHARTVYAGMAALQAAKLNYEAGDANAAKAQLRWVVDNGHVAYAATARVRLAGVLLDDKSYDEALKLLATDVPESHRVMFADRRGDVLVAQGKLDDARAAYKQALDTAGLDHPMRGYIQFKLDALPAAPAAA